VPLKARHSISQWTISSMGLPLRARGQQDSTDHYASPQGRRSTFKFNLDGVTDVNGLTYTFDWHNCNQSEPHTIILISADGQKTKPVGFIYPYDNCK